MSTAYTPATGDVVGGCRLERLAARGGMGVVFEATHLALARRVAVKVISPHLAGDVTFRERFIREAQLAASVHDPHVVDVYDAGEQDGALYLVMRFIDGTDLRTVLTSEGRLDPARAVRITRHVATALDTAHAAGLIHRDVTPSNVLLSGTGEGEHALLTDFGLVKSLETTAATRTGAWLGTVSYVAPEALRGEKVDGRADVYALTCVLHRMLTGHAPFERDSDAAIITAHLHDSPPQPSAAGLPAALDLVVARGLAKHPGDRYATAGALAHAAQAAIDGTAATQPPINAGMPHLDRQAAAGAGGGDGSGAATTSLMPGAGGAPGVTSVDQRVDLTRVMTSEQAPSATRVMAPAGAPAAAAPAHTLSAAGPPPAAGPERPSTTPALRRRGRALAGGALVALLAAGGGFALGAALSAEDPPPPRRPAVPRTPAAVSLIAYSAGAYSVMVPRTWRLVESDAGHDGFRRSSWRAPEPWHARLDISYSAGSRADPQEIASTVRGQTAALATYSEIAFGPIELEGEEVIRWVYGTRGNAHMKWYANPCSTSIAVHGTTRASELLRWAPTFRAVAASLRPAC